MTILSIDGVELDVPAEYTLLQACEAAGIEVPRFCYHDRLSIAGNCRMCLVEVKGSPKPVASCAWSVRDCRPGPNGEPPVVLTRSAMVKKAREGVLEFLLINHPLDCPICDQGGECDLQDQTMAYGFDRSRFAENKRAVEDKYLGPLVKTSMNRCIQCTRCVRFAAEVAGVEELGATGRGEDMEITSYLESAMTSELQGNVIDLCPVGALTSKPYAFKARPWELEKTETVDVMDAVGSNIRVDSRGREVMRILPRLHEAINEEWISDKTRFVWDGLKAQRLDRPYVRRDGRLVPVAWQEAFAVIAERVAATPAARIGAVGGNLATAEELFALKALMTSLGDTNIDMDGGTPGLDPTLGRASYLFNPTIAGLESAEALLVVGADPRAEASLVNARIRKRWRQHGLLVGLVGEAVDLTYPYEHLGAGPETLRLLAEGRHPFADKLKSAANAVVLVGAGALGRADGAAIAALAARVAIALGAVRGDWNGFAVLHDAASRVAGLDLGFVPQAGTPGARQMAEAGALDLLFLLGADELQVAPGAFVVYQGSHGDRGAHRADVVLPGAAYTEKSGIYVNTEGRPQLAKRAVFPPGEAREDWAILRALSEVLGHTLPFDSLAALRQQMLAAAPHLGRLDQVERADPAAVHRLAERGGAVDPTPFRAAIADFYLTNPIARASRVMAECSALRDHPIAEAAE